jgi:hypothetical protein
MAYWVKKMFLPIFVDFERSATNLMVHFILDPILCLKKPSVTQDNIFG